MNIFIRTDSSVEIGTGHVMRCLTIANRERKSGHKVVFICRESEGDSIDLIEQNGFEVYKLPFVEGSIWEFSKNNWITDARETIQIIKDYDVDKMIVDHYSFDEKWESEIRGFVKEIFVIDDLANRRHNCDTLLDQNFHLQMSTRYIGLVPTKTKLLLGPKHALLRDEFINASKNLKPFKSKVERIFIFFGGSDPTNETEKVIHAIAPIIYMYKIKVDVVVGNSNPQKEELEKLCKSISNIKYHCQINNIAEIMAKADLAIGAGGATTWERSYMQLPSIVIAIADNQVEIAKALNELRIIYYLGTSQELDEIAIKEAVVKVINNKALLKEMKSNCIKLYNEERYS